MTVRSIQAWALVAALASGACRGAVAPAMPPAAEHDLGAAIDELRFRIASSPRDLSARVGLAQLELRADRPGAALRHYLVVAEAGTLARADRAALARLLVARAEARVALGDGAAHSDLARARALDPEVPVPDELRHGAAAEAVLAALRAMELDAARAAAEELAPGDPRRALADPESAPLAALGETASWVWDGGARRAGLALLETYRRRGGVDGPLLQRFAAARTWWHGPEGLDYVARRELTARGVELCAVATRVDEDGCALGVAAATLDRARELGRRARALEWRSPEVAWARIALAGWIAGDHPGWLTELADRALPGTTIDEAVAGASILARLDGDEAGARALSRAQLRAVDRWLPADRAVLIAEAGLVGRDDDIDALLDAGASGDGWIVALRAAAASGDPARLPALLGRAPERAREQYLRDRGVFLASTSSADRERARRWRALVDALGYAAAAARLTAMLGVELPEPGGPPLGSVAVPGEPALDRIARAYERDPAVADRLAADYADGVLALGERGPAVAVLFARLGDPARALAWWEAIARSSPLHPGYQLRLVEAAAAAGDPTRALVHATRAAARSGDAGATHTRVARALVAAEAPAEAMQAARAALQLVPPAGRVEVLALVERATERLGRPDEIAAAREARAALVGATAAPARPPRLPLEGPWAPDDAGALAAAAAWSPFDLEVRGRLMRRLDPEDDRFADLVAELVGLGLDDRFPARQRLALALLATALERAGKPAAAAAARAEARTVR